MSSGQTWDRNTLIQKRPVYKNLADRPPWNSNKPALPPIRTWIPLPTGAKSELRGSKLHEKSTRDVPKSSFNGKRRLPAISQSTAIRTDGNVLVTPIRSKPVDSSGTCEFRKMTVLPAIRSRNDSVQKVDKNGNARNSTMSSVDSSRSFAKSDDFVLTPLDLGSTSDTFVSSKEYIERDDMDFEYLSVLPKLCNDKCVPPLDLSFIDMEDGSAAAVHMRREMIPPSPLNVMSRGKYVTQFRKKMGMAKGSIQLKNRSQDRPVLILMPKTSAGGEANKIVGYHSNTEDKYHIMNGTSLGFPYKESESVTTRIQRSQWKGVPPFDEDMLTPSVCSCEDHSSLRSLLDISFGSTRSTDLKNYMAESDSDCYCRDSEYEDEAFDVFDEDWKEGEYGEGLSYNDGFERNNSAASSTHGQSQEIVKKVSKEEKSSQKPSLLWKIRKFFSRR